MRGIQAALTRVPFEGAADERVGLMDVLHGYTAGGAWAAHMEQLTGCLRVGMAADVVMIDGDIEATPPGKIGAMGIALTVVGGHDFVSGRRLIAHLVRLVDCGSMPKRQVLLGFVTVA